MLGTREILRYIFKKKEQACSNCDYNLNSPAIIMDEVVEANEELRNI